MYKLTLAIYLTYRNLKYICVYTHTDTHTHMHSVFQAYTGVHFFMFVTWRQVTAFMGLTIGETLVGLLYWHVAWWSLNN